MPEQLTLYFTEDIIDLTDKISYIYLCAPAENGIITTLCVTPYHGSAFVFKENIPVGLGMRFRWRENCFEVMHIGDPEDDGRRVARGKILE